MPKAKTEDDEARISFVRDKNVVVSVHSKSVDASTSVPGEASADAVLSTMTQTYNLLRGIDDAV